MCLHTWKVPYGRLISMLPLQHCAKPYPQIMHLTMCCENPCLLWIRYNRHPTHLPPKKAHLWLSLNRLTKNLLHPPHHPFRAILQPFLSQPSHQCKIQTLIRHNLCSLINHTASHLQRLTLTTHIIQHTVRHMPTLTHLTRQCKMDIILMSHPLIPLLLQHTTWCLCLHHQKVSTRMIYQAMKRWLWKPCLVLPILKGMPRRICSPGWHRAILYNRISGRPRVRLFKKHIGVVDLRKVRVENID